MIKDVANSEIFKHYYTYINYLALVKNTKPIRTSKIIILYMFAYIFCDRLMWTYPSFTYECGCIVIIRFFAADTSSSTAAVWTCGGSGCNIFWFLNWRHYRRLWHLGRGFGGNVFFGQVKRMLAFATSLHSYWILKQTINDNSEWKKKNNAPATDGRQSTNLPTVGLN